MKVFLIHYVSLAAFITATFLILNYLIKDQNFDSMIKRYSWWALASILVFVASSELLLHVLYFPPLGEAGLPDISTLPQYYNKIREQVLKTGFPVLWGILAFAFLFIGMRKPEKDLRIISLFLLAITLVKLFTYDIKHVSELGKIIAFVLLGIVLLVMAFMYQKIKAIILDDEK